MAPTPFDLNHALIEWRENRRSESTWRDEDLDEMEAHLCDAVAAWRSKGLSPEEAFLVATRRLGPAREVAEELARVHPGEVCRVRAVWMLMGMLLLGMVHDVARVVSQVVMLGGSPWLSDDGAFGWMGLVVRGAILAGAALAFLGFATGRWPARGRRWIDWDRRPVWLIPALIVALLGMRIAAVFSPAALARVLSPSKLGVVYLVQNWGYMVEAFAFIVAAVLVLGRLMRRRSGVARGLAGVWVVAAGLTLGAVPRGEAAASGPVRVAASTASSGVEEVLRLWNAGKKDEALEGFLRVDFARRPLFPKGSPLGYSEKDFMALPRAVNEKMHAQILEEVRTMKGLAVHVKEAAAAARARGDGVRSEACLTQLKKFGAALEHPDSLALLQMVGKAFTKLAAR